MTDSIGTTADVFGELKRFHIYDHSNDAWVMSGVDFGDVAVVQHTCDAEDDETHAFRDPHILVDHDEDLTLIYEDGDRDQYRTGVVDMDVASDAVQEVIEVVADREGVDPSRVKVASLEAPNTVKYFLAPEPVRLDEDEVNE